MDATEMLTATTTMSPPSYTFVKLCLLWTALHRGSQVPQGCRGVLTEENIHQIQLLPNDRFSSILENLKENSGNFRWNRADGDLRKTRVMDDGNKNMNEVRYGFRYTTRSLSVLGVLGGIVLILLVVALSTCIRNKRNVIMENGSHGHEHFARQILIDHIRHLSRHRRVSVDSELEERNAQRLANDVPPAYDEVVKDHDNVVDGPDDEQVENGIEIQSDEVQPPSYVEAMMRETSEQDDKDEDEPEEPRNASSETRAQSHVVQIEIGYDRNDE